MTQKDIQIGRLYRITERGTNHITYLIPVSKVIKHPTTNQYNSVYAVTLDFPDLKRNFTVQWLIDNNLELVEC